MLDVQGKVAILTGGNGGIGLTMAPGLARSGSRAVMASQDSLAR